jgi:hypothetical protein
MAYKITENAKSSIAKFPQTYKKLLEKIPKKAEIIEITAPSSASAPRAKIKTYEVNIKKNYRQGVGYCYNRSSAEDLVKCLKKNLVNVTEVEIVISHDYITV